MFVGQLELGLGRAERPGRMIGRARPGRRSRAQWWFQRMRQAVDGALDWQPAPAAPPEQMIFAGSHRQALTYQPTELESPARQVCA